MNHVNKKFQITIAVTGASTIILMVIMLIVFPIQADLPAGFNTPIIAFEFAKVESDLVYLTGNGETETMNRRKMDAGLQWDMIFPFAYGGFLALLLLKLNFKKYRVALLGLPFAVLIIPFDIYENLTLLGITDALSKTESTEFLLQELHFATWLKWGSIGAAAGVLSVALFRNSEYIFGALSGITAVSIAICWITQSQPFFAEMAAIFMFILLLALAIKEGVCAWQNAFQVG